MDNKTLGLKYYADMNDSPLSDLLKKYNINTNNQLMSLSGYIWQDCPDICISKGVYIIYYQGGKI